MMTSISTRLEAVLALLAPCRMLVDVGTDHALLPVAAVQRGLSERAIAKDLRDAPLVLARKNIEHAGLVDRIAMLKGDGLAALAEGAVDAVVMAGISGKLAVRLCSQAPHVLAGVSQLVIQANSDVSVVRAWGLQHGWHLKNEHMLSERGRFFVTCAFAKGTGEDRAYAVPDWSPSNLCLVGPHLLSRKDPAALAFCEWQCQRLGPLVKQHVHKLAPELQIWQAARAFMQASV